MNNHRCCTVSCQCFLDLDFVIADIRLNDQMNSKKQELLKFHLVKELKNDVLLPVMPSTSSDKFVYTRKLQ